jgi:hypothetical protein
MIVAIQAAIALGPQMQMDIPLADRQVAQPEGFTIFKELCGFLSALPTDRIAASRFEIAFDFLLSDLDIENLNLSKIQQLLDWEFHGLAFDDLWLMTTISWGISRQFPKSQLCSLYATCSA